MLTWTNMTPVDVRLDIVTLRDLKTRPKRRRWYRRACADLPFLDDPFYGLKAVQLEALRRKFDEFTSAAVSVTEGVGLMPVGYREEFDRIEHAVRECQATLEGTLLLGDAAEGWRRFSRGLGRRRPKIEKTMQPYRNRRKAKGEDTDE